MKVNIFKSPEMFNETPFWCRFSKWYF